MDWLTQLKGMVEYKRYVKTLILSTALAVLMLYIALGLLFFAGLRHNPIPRPFILLILAVCFIIATVFYEPRGKSEQPSRKNRVNSLIKGLFLAICATFALVAATGGVILTIEGGTPDVNIMISALAVCLIVSMVFLSMVKPHKY